MAELTANKLWKSATEKGLASIPFAEWIEEKNKQFAFYQSEKNGKMSFIEWEYKNQNPINNTKYFVGGTVVVLAGITIYQIYKTINNKK